VSRVAARPGRGRRRVAPRSRLCSGPPVAAGVGGPYWGDEFTYYQPTAPRSRCGCSATSSTPSRRRPTGTRSSRTRTAASGATRSDRRRRLVRLLGIVAESTDRLGRAVARGLAKHQRLSAEAHRQRVREDSSGWAATPGAAARLAGGPPAADGLAALGDGNQPLSPPSSPTVGRRTALVLLLAFPTGRRTSPSARRRWTPTATSLATPPGATTARCTTTSTRSRRAAALQRAGHRYYTAAHERSYYTDESIPTARGPRADHRGARGLKAQGFDFTQCDGNGDAGSTA